MTRVWSTAEVVVTVAVSGCLLTVAVCPAAVAEETLGDLVQHLVVRSHEVGVR